MLGWGWTYRDISCDICRYLKVSILFGLSFCRSSHLSFLCPINLDLEWLFSLDAHFFGLSLTIIAPEITLIRFSTRFFDKRCNNCWIKIDIYNIAEIQNQVSQEPYLEENKVAVFSSSLSLTPTEFNLLIRLLNSFRCFWKKRGFFIFRAQVPSELDPIWHWISPIDSLTCSQNVLRSFTTTKTSF